MEECLYGEMFIWSKNIIVLEMPFLIELYTLLHYKTVKEKPILHGPVVTTLEINKLSLGIIESCLHVKQDKSKSYLFFNNKSSLWQQLYFFALLMHKMKIRRVTKSD